MGQWGRNCEQRTIWKRIIPRKPKRNHQCDKARERLSGTYTDRWRKESHLPIVSSDRYRYHSSDNAFTVSHWRQPKLCPWPRNQCLFPLSWKLKKWRQRYRLNLQWDQAMQVQTRLPDARENCQESRFHCCARRALSSKQNWQICHWWSSLCESLGLGLPERLSQFVHTEAALP